MAGPAQLFPNDRMRAYLRSILAAEPGVDQGLADRLTERLVKRIARMLVWDSSGANATDAPPAIDPQASSASSSTASTAGPAASAADATSVATTPAPEAADSFDPFAFSIVVILKRQGATALMKRLESIKDPAQLHRMATAQHIGVDKSISALKALRQAIVQGAEQRLADRRAAAS